MTDCEECGCPTVRDHVTFTRFDEGVPRIFFFCCAECLRFWLRRWDCMPNKGSRIG